MSDHHDGDRGGGGRRGRGGGGGGGSSGRGGGGGGGFNRHKHSMNFQQRVPKFIATMLAQNPGAKLQGQVVRAAPSTNGDDGGEVLIEIESTRPSVPEGVDRPDREDEAPQIANLEEFADHDLTHIITTQKQNNGNEKGDAAAAAGAGASSAVAASSTSVSSSAGVSASPVALSLTDARLLSVKRIRQNDAEADAIEKETGKHIFRKAITKTTCEEDGTTNKRKDNEGLTPEEMARKKKQKRDNEKKAKSMLTFNEDEI